MGVCVVNSTYHGSVTPICSSCGVALCWDVENEEYEKHKEFWDNWTCRDCNPEYNGAYERFKKNKETMEVKETENKKVELFKDDKIVGTIERIIYKNEENGYHVLSVLLRDRGKEYTVTTNQLKIHEGTTMEFYGQWVSNPRYGNQFKAERTVEIAPETQEAMVKYLSSSFFKGIGPVIAKKIVSHFGERVLEVLKTDIDKLIEVPGISRKKLDAIRMAWIENSEINEIMVFLQSYNISTLFATKIYEIYGRDCINKIRLNPYQLADDIKGIGFKFADSIAMDMGIPKDSKQRISAAIRYILVEGQKDGHCYLLHHQVLDKTTALLEVRIKEKIDEILEDLIKDNEIKLSNIAEENRYYANEMFYDERYCSHKIDILKTAGRNFDERIIEYWEKGLEEENVKLSDEQLNSIKEIVKNGVSVLTGGPGCGKTTTLKYLIELLSELKLSYTLVAPTGRASQRMMETTGCEASTIHRLLGWDHINKCFMHNEKNQINCEFLIVDETSMVDISLAASLLRAIPQDCQMLFIGDVDQLPPVGPGSFFKDLINSGFVNTYVLNKIFRQGAGSDIIKYAHEVNKGIEPQIDSPIIDPQLWNQKTDCLFVDSELADPYKTYTDYPDWSSLYYGVDAIGMITRLYTETIKKYYGEGLEVQILCPMNVGDVGAIKINEIIQDAVNPPSPEKLEIKVKSKFLRQGDRVIQIVNNYELGVFNGDIGKVVMVNPAEKQCIVEFGSENKSVLYKRDQLLELKLAYCITIHKSQGSEFDCVILPLMNQHFAMLYRNLIYTGLTRAKKLCVFVGQRGAFSRSINNIKQTKRQTSLIELFKLKNLAV
jgi:exodeoxyribonuclease V alpha subunit